MTEMYDQYPIAPISSRRRKPEPELMIAPVPARADSQIRLQGLQQDRNAAARVAGVRGFNDAWAQEDLSNLDNLGRKYGVARGNASMGGQVRPQNDDEYMGAIRQRAQQQYLNQIAPTLAPVQAIQTGTDPTRQLAESVRRGYSPETLALRQGAVDRQAADTGLVRNQGYAIERTADAQYADASGREAKNRAEAYNTIPAQARVLNSQAQRVESLTPLEAQKQQLANSLDQQLIAPRVAQAGADVQKTQIENTTNEQLIAPRVRTAGAQAQQAEQMIAPSVRGANAQAGVAEAQAEALRAGGMRIGPGGKYQSATMTPEQRAAAVKAATNGVDGAVNRDALGYIESGQWPEPAQVETVMPTPGITDRAKAGAEAANATANPTDSLGTAAQWLVPGVPLARKVVAGYQAFRNPQQAQAGQPQQTGQKKPLTPEIARQFLTQAGGDRAKARQMATAAGYVF